MLQTLRRLSFAAVLLLAACSPARADDQNGSRVSKEYLTIVKVETRYLVRAVERLQETIIEEMSGRKERDLYRHADEVLSLLVDFERSLEPGASRERLYSRFAELEGRLNELLEVVRKEGK